MTRRYVIQSQWRAIHYFPLRCGWLDVYGHNVASREVLELCDLGIFHIVQKQELKFIKNIIQTRVKVRVSFWLGSEDLELLYRYFIANRRLPDCLLQSAENEGPSKLLFRLNLHIHRTMNTDPELHQLPQQRQFAKGPITALFKCLTLRPKTSLQKKSTILVSQNLNRGHKYFMSKVNVDNVNYESSEL